MDNLAAEPVASAPVDRTVPAGIAMPAKKGGKGAVVLAIVFALIAVGLGVWIAILLLNPAKGGESGGNSANGGNAGNGGSAGNTVSVSSRDDEIQNLLDEMGNSYSVGGYTADRFYTDYGLPIKVSDKIWAESARSYGVTVKKFADSEGSATEIRNSVVNVLKTKGLKNVSIPYFDWSGAVAGNDTTGYFKSDDGIYCMVSDISKVEGSGNDVGYSWFQYQCMDEGWLTEGNKELAINLATAYNNANDGNSISYIGGTLTRKIKKNPAGTYEKITVGFADAVALFYRKVGGEWKFFTAAQSAITCDTYNTAELKEAYKGEKCWDESSSKDVTL